MLVVAALGGNALLRRGQPLTAQNQRANVEVAARALLPIVLEHDLVLIIDDVITARNAVDRTGPIR